MTDLATLGIRVQTGDLKEGATALSSLTTHGKQAERATDALAATSRRAGSQVAAFGGQMQMSAGHTANLTAQLNDIGIMMAAGQNPLQLALQQGTQINQVFAQLGGGRGAIRAVGAAFMSLLSPINLATIGIIAFGGAAVNWLMQSRNEAESLEDVTGRLSDTLGAVRDAADMAQMSVAELTEEYGANAVAARENLREFLQFERALASKDLQQAVTGLSAAFNDLFGPLQVGRGGAQDVAASLGVPIDAVKLLAREAQNLKAALTFDEQQEAINEIGRVFSDMGVPLEKLPRELIEALRAASSMEDVMLALEGALGGSADEAERLARNLGGGGVSGPDAAIAELQRSGRIGGELSGVVGRMTVNDPDRRRRSRSSGSNVDERAREAARIFEDTRTATERYAAELADLNELQEMGYINADTHARAVDMLAEKFETGSDIAATFGRTIASLGADMVLSLGRGENAVESLLDSMARLALNTVFQQFVAPGLEQGLSGILPDFGGARANGGPVQGGKSYLVGERGPELFTPSASGAITPNGALGGMQVVINNNSPAQVTAQRGPGGRLDVSIDEQVAAAITAPRTSAAMRQAYGLRRTT